METKLKSVVIRHVGKAAHRYWTDVICDIIAVYQGIKIGFLYDYGVISSGSLVSLVSDVSMVTSASNTVTEGLNRKLCVITLGLDVMLVNTELLLRRLEQQELRMESSAISNIVDISSDLTSPCALNFSSQRGGKLKEELHNCFTQCHTLYCETGTSSKVVEIDLTLTEDLNLTTVFGLFIGYPVVYWFQGGAEAGNCLDMVPLVVYELTCDVTKNDGSSQTNKTNDKRSQHSSSATNETSKASGRGPQTSGGASSAKSFSNTGNETVCLPKDRSVFKSHHVVYSFSVPECLDEDFVEEINSWFQNLKCDHQDLLVTNLQLHRKVVTLPTVAL